VVWGWAVAVPLSAAGADHLPGAARAGSPNLIALGVAVVVVPPALALLYTLAQKSLVEETSRPSQLRRGGIMVKP
jgi:hypothetical protein